MTDTCRIPEKTTNRFPPATWLTLTGIGLLVLLLIGDTRSPQGESFMPLLAKLAICELGFIVSAIAAFIGCKADWGNCRPTINSFSAMVGFVLAIYFAATGIQLWPQ